MYNSSGILVALIFITVGLGFKLSPAPFHQWTPNVYEGVWFIRPNSYLYLRSLGFAKLHRHVEKKCYPLIGDL
jgi:hypothetical protein